MQTLITPPAATATAAVSGTSAADQHRYDQMVADAEALLMKSPTGAAVVKSLHDNHIPIVVMSSREFYSKYQDGRAGFFSAADHTITVPDGDIADPVDGAVMFAHEGTHAKNYVDQHGIAGTIGGTALAMAKGLVLAPFKLQNPATSGVDAIRSHVNDDEVSAYMAQARVEEDLHITARRVADYGHNADGSLASEAQTRAAIDRTGLYQLRGPTRTVMATLMASIAGIGIGELGTTVIERVTHTEVAGWKTYAAIGALTGAMALGDWVTHRGPATDS